MPCAVHRTSKTVRIVFQILAQCYSPYGLCRGIAASLTAECMHNRPMHFLIPFAATSTNASAQAFQALKLPHLQRLMQHMQLHSSDVGDTYSLSPPHERALAQALGLPQRHTGRNPCEPRFPDGCIPWAAAELSQRRPDQPRHGYRAGQAWAHITPCYWRVGVDNITLPDPASLQISDADSHTLLAAMQPYFAEDGITLHWDSAGHWLAHSALFEGLPTASLDRVTGRNINPWMPEAAQAAPLRRLYNEMQMLLYTHPVNDARQTTGLPPVNAFWVHGAGSLPEQPETEQIPPVQSITALRSPALQENWPAWAAAWQQIDSTHLAAACTHLSQGESVQLTLCGERSALQYRSIKTSAFNRILRSIRPKPLSILLEQL